MTITQLEEKLSLKRLSHGEDKEISSCYICDLLSQVLGSCEQGDVWITVQTSLNVVAVAQMTEVSCVIVPENIPVPDNVIEKASEENLTIFSSAKNSFSLACEIAALIQ